MSAVQTAPDPDREIDRYGVLSDAPGRELQALVGLAAQLFGVPNAAINLITGTKQHQVAAVGFEPSICSREDSMCAAVVSEPLPVVVADASRDGRGSKRPGTSFVRRPVGASTSSCRR